MSIINDQQRPAVKLAKVCAGHYRLKTGNGLLDRYEIEMLDAGYGPGWFLTYPGDLLAGDVCETLQAAREQIAAHMAI